MLVCLMCLLEQRQHCVFTVTMCYLVQCVLVLVFMPVCVTVMAHIYYATRILQQRVDRFIYRIFCFLCFTSCYFYISSQLLSICAPSFSAYLTVTRHFDSWRCVIVRQAQWLFDEETFLFIYLFMPTFRHFLFIYYFATKSFGHFKQLHISYLYFFGFGYLNCHNNAFGHFFRRYDLTEVMCMLHFPLFVKPLLKCLRFLFNYANKQTLIFTTPNIIMGFQKGCIQV